MTIPPSLSEGSTHTLPSGTLRILDTHGPWPLDELLTLGVRQNPRRGFLFISRVLGRHLDIVPRRFTEAVDALTERLRDLEAGRGPLEGPVLFVAMAETATGLGEALARRYASESSRGDVLVTTTTRRSLPFEPLEFDEVHSHAPTQRLYVTPAVRRAAPRSVVLVDDEVTTGRTLALLAERLTSTLPVTRAVFANLVDWLPVEGFAALPRSPGVTFDRVSLGGGSFTFTPDPTFRVALPEFRERTVNAPGGSVREGSSAHLEPRAVTIEHLTGRLDVTRAVRVLGTGEYAFEPYRIARALEERGFDVTWQTMSRSPIHPWGDIHTRFETVDDGGSGAPLYAYNLPVEAGAQVVLCTERGRGDLTLPAHLNVHSPLDLDLQKFP